jgi:hypothetical protein
MRVRRGVHRQGIQKCGGVTLPFSFCIFGRALTAQARDISIITHPQQFVKRKVEKK